MSKFASLVADVSKPFRVELIDPVTEDVIRDKQGKAAFIEVWAADGEKGRDFDKSKRKELTLKVRQSRTGKVDQGDALDLNIAKCAFLTNDWYLVDPVTREHIDVECTPDNAIELYSEPGAGWLFLQPWVAASDAANFLRKPPTISTGTPNGVSATTEN